MALKIFTATLCRVILNTSRRFAYPFAPALSRGLGVELTAITSLIAANQVTALFGIFFGPAADRLGYRLMMLAALAMLALGMFAGGFFPFYGVILIALFLAGLGKTIFDPAVQAYVSERVSFKKRGLVIGLIEYSWALSTLVGMPLIAFLIDRFGWRSPFIVLGGLSLLGMIILAGVIPRDDKKNGSHQASIGIWRAWRQLIRKRAALGALGFAFFLSAANDNLFVVYGAWLEKSFDLSIIAIGMSTGLIGLAELSGETLTAAFADRFGIKQTVNIALILCVMSYGILPFLGLTLPMALAGLFFIFLTFEFTMVTGISLSTELLPEYRATMMSGFFAAAGLGRIVGALMGGHIWLAGGIAVTCFTSAAVTFLGLASLTWGLQGWRQ
ncbi:MAG: MFS transporter [Thermodesulfobacteriota bacterium]|nr:MFS transporter [Thermodesulfobacteriota bacterium]